MNNMLRIVCVTVKGRAAILLNKNATLKKLGALTELVYIIQIIFLERFQAGLQMVGIIPAEVK